MTKFMDMKLSRNLRVRALRVSPEYTLILVKQQMCPAHYTKETKEAGT
ncbi:hypothetical protein [Lysinibacillus sphaericus]|nr:hypothetical protein [Lysinibacillus sphaericus]